MEWVITENDLSLRLDKLLSEKSDLSRNQCQTSIDQGFVSVNGQNVKKRVRLKVGDRLLFTPPEKPERKLTPFAMPLDVVFEDDDIIVINKPAGISTHPSPNDTQSTLVEALIFHCGTLPDAGDPLRPGIVHRLDKDTTGLLVAAKSAPAQKGLTRAFAERTVEKTYLAITVGNPGEQTVETQIGRNPNKRQEMAVVVNGGKKAITHIQPITWNHELALVSVRIETGRTHQIRVHLKHCKTPVLGDTVYGTEKINRKKEVGSQLLHAHTLAFAHPITGKKMSFTIPHPNSWEKIINDIRQTHLNK